MLRTTDLHCYTYIECTPDILLWVCFISKNHILLFYVRYLFIMFIFKLEKPYNNQIYRKMQKIVFKKINVILQFQKNTSILYFDLHFSFRL